MDLRGPSSQMRLLLVRLGWSIPQLNSYSRLTLVRALQKGTPFRQREVYTFELFLKVFRRR